MAGVDVRIPGTSIDAIAQQIPQVTYTDLIWFARHSLALVGTAYADPNTTGALSSDCAPLIRAAIAYLATQTKGAGRQILKLPAGTLRCKSLIGVVPPDVGMEGADPKNASITTLSFRINSSNACVDLGASPTKLGGHAAIIFANPAGRFTALKGVSLEGENGPNIAAAIGATTSGKMAPPERYGTGIRFGSNTTLSNVDVKGFCYGIEWKWDHQRLENVNCAQNWAGIYFGPRSQNQGDGYIQDFTLTGNYWASYACHPTHYLGGLHLFGSGHTGYGPGGIWKMHDNRRQADYAVGTVALTNGSQVVTGTGSAWLLAAKQNGHLKIGSTIYDIASVDSDTQLTLTQAWAGTTQSGTSYTIVDGAALSSLILNGCTIEGMAFENCTKFNLAHESVYTGVTQTTAPGLVAGTVFAGVKSAGSASDSDAFYGWALDSFKQTAFIGSSAAFDGAWKSAVIALFNGFVGDTDLGDVTDGITKCRANGVPFFAYTGASILFTKGVKAHSDQGELEFAGIQNGTTPPVQGDLLRMRDTAVAYGITAQGYDSAGKMALGVAATRADQKGAVPYFSASGRRSRVAVNVAPSVVVTAAAVINATSVTVNATGRLGASGTAVTLVDSSGTQRVVGTVDAGGTTITASSVPTAIAAGTQLWVQRTAGAQVAANAWVKPRYGATGGGTTVTDQAQILGATNWLDSDNPVIGAASSTADNGRTVEALVGV